MSGKKRPTSVPQQLREFYANNRHEELSIPDMMAKFGCSKSTVRDALRSMDGQLERVLVYRLKNAGQKS